MSGCRFGSSVNWACSMGFFETNLIRVLCDIGILAATAWSGPGSAGLSSCGEFAMNLSRRGLSRYSIPERRREKFEVSGAFNGCSMPE